MGGMNCEYKFNKGTSKIPEWVVVSHKYHNFLTTNKMCVRCGVEKSVDTSRSHLKG